MRTQQREVDSGRWKIVGNRDSEAGKYGLRRERIERKRKRVVGDEAGDDLSQMTSLCFRSAFVPGVFSGHRMCDAWCRTTQHIAQDLYHSRQQLDIPINLYGSRFTFTRAKWCQLGPVK